MVAGFRGRLGLWVSAGRKEKYNYTYRGVKLNNNKKGLRGGRVFSTDSC